ncbi:MAG: hypothetical protein MJ252_10395 [archaeon]|nr:hypothetical protein [archaeon]
MNYDVIPYLDQYIKGVKVIELLNQVSGFEFKKLRIKEKDGFHVLSIGLVEDF